MNFSRRIFLRSVVAVTLRPTRTFADDRPIMRFGVLSDTHVRADPKTAETLRKELRRFSREEVRAVVISGDLCEVGTLKELENVMDAWYEAFPGGCNAAGEPVELIVAFGNHDYHDASYLKSGPIREEDRKLGIFFNKDMAWRMITGRPFEGLVGERYHDANPWYFPWNPNASGAGRMLQMLNDEKVMAR